MPSLNHCEFIGNLGREPEMRYTPSGTAVAQFTVAVNRNWKNKETEEWEQETEWVRAVVWGEQAERLSDAESGSHISKGDLVYLSGRMQTRQWEDQSGQKRYTTEIVANRVMRLKRKGEGRDEAPLPDEPAGARREPAAAASGGGSDYEDLPF